MRGPIRLDIAFSLSLSLSLACAALCLFAAPTPAAAFCGFYVGSADSKLYNDATTVVLMREGTRTVLSMQNSYQGPLADFAMVVPVPVVLQESDVRTLPPEVFDRVEQLTAPRLVETWEHDPCSTRVNFGQARNIPVGGTSRDFAPGLEPRRGDLGVRVEATFAVGEYKIEVLSARDSTGLEAWLRLHDYAIPAGAEPLLRPYVQAGMNFFVAKVDIKKVRTIDGKAGSRTILSPLRFHYDSPNFTLPVRLGLINAGAAQDLIVHILARGDRYEVANYANIAIPTNIDVHERTRDAFGQFYAALFDRVSAQHPGAVVTEYAWSVTKCDPCPAPPLDKVELATLGADVLPAPAPKPGVPEGFVEPFAITRLHARYGRENLGQDMVFRSAPPIVGGLDASPWADYGPPTEDRFQARYVIRHPWEGPIDCANPNRGMWGPPPDNVAASPGPVAATGLAFVARSANLVGFLAGDTPMRELLATATLPPGPAPAKTYAGGFANVVPLSPTAPEPQAEPGVALDPASAEPEPSASGCSRCSVEPTGNPYSALAMGLTLGLVLRRRQRGAP